MSQISPSSASSSHSAALHVSLAGGSQPSPLEGTSHDSLTTALDDAVTKLHAVTQTLPPEQNEASQDSHAEGADTREANQLFALIQAMSSSPSRREAARELVEFIASQSEGCSVRCGIGKGRLNYLLDSRLGWLGPESSLHQEACARWEAPRRRADDPQIDDAHYDIQEDSGEIVLPQPGGSGRCVVWVKACKPQSLWQLAPAVTVLGSVLWSRPLRSWPSFAVRMARHTSMSLAAAAILIAVLAIWPVHYRVACTAHVETIQQRMVATPFEATLLKTNVKPGDAVTAGDVLLVLDGRPLRLEREGIEAEIQQVAKEHDVALATRRIADAQQAALKEQQLRRQHDLLTDRLGRLEVVSPIDGVVVSGDLEKFVGSPLERGQALIEVAPMNQMIIEVEIPEHEVGYVSKGAEVRVKLDAIGGKSIRMPLSDVFPSSELRDDRNVFIGRIVIDNTDGQLRPGMRGEATTYGPLRPWIWSWLRGGFERVLWWIGY